MFYFDDNANVNALRYDDWKISFAWIEGHLFSGKRMTQNVPIVTNLRQDPFERYHDQSGAYERWWGDKLWTLIPAQAIVAQFLESFKNYPPSQKSGSFDIGQFLEALQSGEQVTKFGLGAAGAAPSEIKASFLDTQSPPGFASLQIRGSKSKALLII